VINDIVWIRNTSDGHVMSLQDLLQRLQGLQQQIKVQSAPSEAQARTPPVVTPKPG
jgi:hypothetical protein